MLFHGIGKLRSGISGVEEATTAKGLPEAIAYGVYVGEVLAPLLVLVGVFGRLGGLLIAFTMAMSIWLAFSDRPFGLTEHGTLVTELNLFYLLCGLSIFFSGSGRYSLRRGEGRWD